MRIAYENLQADILRLQAEARETAGRIQELEDEVARLERENADLLDEVDRLNDELQGSDL